MKPDNIRSRKIRAQIDQLRSVQAKTTLSGCLQEVIKNATMEPQKSDLMDKISEQIDKYNKNLTAKGLQDLKKECSDIVIEAKSLKPVKTYTQTRTLEKKPQTPAPNLSNRRVAPILSGAPNVASRVPFVETEEPKARTKSNVANRPMRMPQNIVPKVVSRVPAREEPAKMVKATSLPAKSTQPKILPAVERPLRPIRPMPIKRAGLVSRKTTENAVQPEPKANLSVYGLVSKDSQDDNAKAVKQFIDDLVALRTFARISFGITKNTPDGLYSGGEPRDMFDNKMMLKLMDQQESFVGPIKEILERVVGEVLDIQKRLKGLLSNYKPENVLDMQNQFSDKKLDNMHVALNRLINDATTLNKDSTWENKNDSYLNDFIKTLRATLTMADPMIDSSLKKCLYDPEITTAEVFAVNSEQKVESGEAQAVKLPELDWESLRQEQQKIRKEQGLLEDPKKKTSLPVRGVGVTRPAIAPHKTSRGQEVAQAVAFFAEQIKTPDSKGR